MSEIKLHFAPRSRSFTALWLLEELGEPYDLVSFDLASNHHKTEEYLALNPMGKVPVVVDHGIAVSEVGAIAIYLADKYRNVVLSPPIDSPERPAFLRWVFFSSAIMEPALGEKFFNWNVPARSVAWGSFDDMMRVLTAGVKDSKFLLGETFSAADVIVGATARFGVMFGAMPKEGPVADYVARLTERPAFVRASEIEARESAKFPMAR